MIGRVVGRFRIDSKLGEGGLGTVWKAHDELLRRDVAVKVLQDSIAQDERSRRRFLHEARTAAALNHPGIVAVIDAGESDGAVYMALALVRGETLARRIEHRLMPMSDAVRIARALADALGYAHGQGVVHRDVSARNVMIGEDERVYLLDFGLALAYGQSRITSTQTTMGTVAYMAPEMLRGEHANVRSDLYALGVVIYEALTGGHPFPGDRSQVMAYSSLNIPPIPPRQRRREIPESLERVVLRAIARDPDDRYESASALVAALDAVEHDVRQADEVPGAAPAFRPAAEHETTQPIRRVAAPTITPEAPAAPPEAASSVRPNPLYLAVREFELTGSDPDGSAAALARRLPQTLRAALGAAHGVRVLAAEVHLPNDETDVFAAARRAGANAVLRGCVGTAAATMRVTFHVSELARGEQLASGVVDGSAFRPFDLEDQVVASVARALELEMPSNSRPSGPSRPPDPAAPDRYRQARSYLLRDDHEASVDGAIHVLENLLEAEPDRAEYHATLARAFVHKLDLTKSREWEARAATAAARARQLHATSIETLLALGAVHRATGRADEAIAVYERALDLAPNVVEARLGLAASFLAFGRFEDAERAARVAVDHAPTDWRAHSWLGKVLFEIGRSEEALDCYRRVIELVPDSARGRRNLGTMLYRLDRLAEAADHYRAAIAIQPDALSYSNLGTALYFMSDYDGAATAFRRAVDLRPEEPLLWGNLGNACHWIPNLRAEGDAALDRAIALTLERLDRDSVDAMGQARLAGWLANRGDLAGAESAISHALDMKPDDNECLVRAGHVYFQLGRKEQAIEFFRRAIERGYGREELRRSRELAELLRDPAFRRLVEREQA